VILDKMLTNYFRLITESLGDHAAILEFGATNSPVERNCG